MKQLSCRIKNKTLRRILVSTSGMMLTNWIFQGMRYMDFFEVCHRLCFEILVFLLLFVLFSITLKPLYALIFALVISHSIMWFVNGHFFALIRGKKTEPNSFLDYIDRLHKRLTNVNYLRGVVIFGGLCKGKYSVYSDLDLRVIKSGGFLNSIKACNYAFIERLRALIYMFPLEIYVFDDFDELDKENKKQRSPIIVYDPKSKLKIKYPTGKNYATFKDEFYASYCKLK